MVNSLESISRYRSSTNTSTDGRDVWCLFTVWTARAVLPVIKFSPGVFFLSLSPDFPLSTFSLSTLPDRRHLSGERRGKIWPFEFVAARVSPFCLLTRMESCEHLFGGITHRVYICDLLSVMAYPPVTGEMQMHLVGGKGGTSHESLDRSFRYASPPNT